MDLSPFGLAQPPSGPRGHGDRDDALPVSDRDDGLAAIAALAALAALPRARPLTICAADPTLWCTDAARTTPTHPAAPAARGLFLNARLIQGIFDDANATTRALWAYPGGAPFSADRQTDELAGNLSAYAACGLDGFTVGLQGGGPFAAFPADQPNDSSGFSRAGAPAAAYLARLGRLLDAAAAARLTPIVSLFYQGQARRLAGDAAVAAALDAVVDWLVARGGPHPLLEVANEIGERAFPPSLQRDTVAALILRARARARGALLVSTSFLGAQPPPDAAIAASDYVTIHCNNEGPANVTAQVAAVRASAAYIAAPKPIVFNECGTDLRVMDAAVAARASWGFYSQGARGYKIGYQTPPTNWRVDSSNATAAFFARVAALAGRAETCAAA